jgi:general secretion pathway protein E
MVAQLGLARFAGDGPATVFRPVGCAQCGGTGYFGRTGIAEMLIVSDELRPLLLRRADAREIHRAAVAQGMRSLFEDGLGKVASGVTSIDEVLRVTGDG